MLVKRICVCSIILSMTFCSQDYTFIFTANANNQQKKSMAYTCKIEIAQSVLYMCEPERVSCSYWFCCLFFSHLSKVVDSSWSNVVTLSVCFLLITFQTKLLFTIASLRTKCVNIDYAKYILKLVFSCILSISGNVNDFVDDNERERRRYKSNLIQC